MRTRANPWLQLPESPPYVLPEDADYVRAWNEVSGRQNERRLLRLDVLPDPFVGRRDAPLVVLALNPGWAGSEAEDHRDGLGDVLLGNFGDDQARHVIPGFLDRFADTAGGRWVRRAYRRVVEHAAISWEDLAYRVLTLEFHGYHSQDWAPFPVTLPSQWFSFDLVHQAMERDAVVVMLRGRRFWEVAVPGLREYPRAFATNTARSASVSPGNLPPGAFDQLIEAVAQPGKSS
jgi:hypothetical protein